LKKTEGREKLWGGASFDDLEAKELIQELKSISKMLQ
jgi:hypothetical protein